MTCNSWLVETVVGDLAQVADRRAGQAVLIVYDHC